jgi:hypothetical protein
METQMRLSKREKLGVWTMIFATAATPAAALYAMGLTNVPALAVIAVVSFGSAVYSATGRD